MVDLTHLRDYNKRIEQYAEDEMTNLMEVLTCGVSVEEYIGLDYNQPIECDLDTLEREAVKNDSGGHSVDEIKIGPIEALKRFLRLSSLLLLQLDSNELTKKLASITDHYRKQCSMRKTRCTMGAFLRTDSD